MVKRAANRQPLFLSFIKPDNRDNIPLPGIWHRRRKVVEAMGDTTYRVYPYRWTVLGSFMLVNLVMQALWIDFAPIMRDAASYYGVSELAIGFLAMLFMIVFLPMSIPVSWRSTVSVSGNPRGWAQYSMAAFALVRAIAGRATPLPLSGRSASPWPSPSS